MQSQLNKKTQIVLSICLALAIISCVFIGETMAGKNKGGDDIILYNGNIVLRGSGKKGKGGGSIVVANSPMNDYGGYGGYFGRK